MKQTKQTLFVAITCLLISSVSMAQTKSGNTDQQVGMDIQAAVEVTFTSTGTDVGNTVNMSFDNVGDYANGVTSSVQEISILSNKNFSVTVKSSAEHFSYAGSTTPTPSMPVNGVLRLLVSSNATGGNISSPFSTSAYSTINNTDQSLISNGVTGQNKKFAVQYKATPGFSYPAGTYSVDVIYTASQL